MGGDFQPAFSSDMLLYASGLSNDQAIDDNEAHN
jgi:hypothetical protein